MREDYKVGDKVWTYMDTVREGVIEQINTIERKDGTVERLFFVNSNGRGEFKKEEAISHSRGGLINKL